MVHSKQDCDSVPGVILRPATVVLAVLFTLTVVASRVTQAQTYTVIHNFTGGQDGADPQTGLTMDGAGNLYGTSDRAGGAGYGTVFKLASKGSSWVFSPLYSFTGGNDAYPSGVILGSNGTLFGTTFGPPPGGSVFNLRPSPRACTTALCPWTETVLYAFTGGNQGSNPSGEVVFDQSGNIYGATSYGGSGCSFPGCGVVYELMPSGGGWTEEAIYAFSFAGGAYPAGRLIFDGAGNLYGTTTSAGAYGYGTVYQLEPSGGAWRENLLHSFQGGKDGSAPAAGLIFDQVGNLYGTTPLGSLGNGTVFELTPSGGNWTFKLLYSFPGQNGGGPMASLTMDAAGVLYGTTYGTGANNFGSVFKLTPSGGGWTYTSLHDFTGGDDGNNPISNVLLHPNGKLYGTASGGGSQGFGVVWEITP
jgi:uncharacterized repeat protein (TIGR03803 family)